jgi:hypothetical protein
VTGANYAALADVIKAAAFPPEAVEALRLASEGATKAMGDVAALAAAVAPAVEAARRLGEAFSRTVETPR